MTARGWRVIGDARSVAHGPVWFRLLDDVTGQAPIGPVSARLELRDQQRWLPTDVAASVTAGGTLTFPGLERRRVALGTPPRRYRLRLDATYYRPLYRAGADGVEFDASPHNDHTPPIPAPARVDLVLLPAVAYPYPGHVRSLRGRVLDPSGASVEDALVEVTTAVGGQFRQERTLTDQRGAFVLPLQWAADGTTAAVAATDHRTGATSTVQVIVPSGLGSNRDIVIP